MLKNFQKLKNNHNKLTTISDAWRNAYGKDYEEGLHFLLNTNDFQKETQKEYALRFMKKDLFNTLLEIGTFTKGIMRSIQMY